MANHYHKGAPGRAHEVDPRNLQTEIEAFLAGCRRPALLEPGEDPIPLISGEYAWETREKGLYLSCWSGERGLQRSITAIKTRKREGLTCIVRRFGGMEGQLYLFDLGHPRASFRLEQGGRRSFLALFRQMLNRQFPGWTVSALSTEMNLERSLSPKYPRAVLQRGQTKIAAAACPSHEDESHFLSFALLWHHYVASGLHAQVPLALFVPQKAGQLTALRLRWLNVESRIFRFNENGSAGEVDKADLGNLETRLAPVMPLPPGLRTFLEPLKQCTGVQCFAEGGLFMLRLRGLAFAAVRDGDFYLTNGSSGALSPATAAQVSAAALELDYVRHGERGQHEDFRFRAEPERWLESALLDQMQVLSPCFEGSPVHRQLTTFLSLDRDMVDLLTVDSTGYERGRLAVVELKATEDVHLPLQALDYWIHIRLHQQQGELTPYFPNISLNNMAPRLFLVAPAITFHPANETVLSYFCAEIVTERVGLNLEWQQGLKILFRLKGAEKPQSQRSLS